MRESAKALSRRLKLEIKKAYAVISKPELRAKYDQSLVAALMKSQSEDRDLLPPQKKSPKSPTAKSTNPLAKDSSLNINSTRQSNSMPTGDSDGGSNTFC